MLLWFLLFGLIIAISFFLAYQSMQDFQEKASTKGVENSVYLIRHPYGLTPQVLEQLHDLTLKHGYIFSLERLFKGTRAALVIFGPRLILQKYTQQLHLLELEDYTAINQLNVTAWEMGVKDMLVFHTSVLNNIFKKMPTLDNNDQFWWQIVLQPQKQNLLLKLLSNQNSIIETIMRWIGFPSSYKSYNLVVNKAILTDPQTKLVLQRKSMQKSFLAQIRCMVVADDENKRRGLMSILEIIGGDQLVKVPKPITSIQILDSYKSRTIPVTSDTSLSITAEEVQQLALNYG